MSAGRGLDAQAPPTPPKSTARRLEVVGKSAIWCKVVHADASPCSLYVAISCHADSLYAEATVAARLFCQALRVSWTMWRCWRQTLYGISSMIFGFLLRCIQCIGLTV